MPYAVSLGDKSNILNHWITEYPLAILIHVTTTASQENKIPVSDDIVITSQSEMYSQKDKQQ